MKIDFMRVFWICLMSTVLGTVSVAAPDPAIETPVDLRVQALTKKAIEQEKAGNLRAAYEKYEQAHLAAIEAKRADLAAQVLYDHGVTLNGEGALEDAVAYYEQAIELLEDAPDHVALASRARLRWAMAVNAMGSPDLADQAVTVAQQALSSAGDEEGLAFVRFAQVDMYARRGDHASAIEQADLAIEYYQKRDATRELAAMHGLKAWCLQQIGAYEEAREAYHRQLEAAFAAGMQRHVATAYCNLGDVERELGKADVAEQHLDRSIKLLDDLRQATTGGASARRAFLDAQVSAYHAKIVTLIDRGEHEAAFEIAEQFRGRAFLEQAQDTREQESLTVEERHTLDELLELQRTLLEGRLGENDQARLQELEKRWLRLQRARERTRAPKFAERAPATAAELQSQLPPATAFVSFWVHPHRTLGWVVSRESIDVIQIPVDSKRLGHQIEAYLGPIRSRARAEDIAVRGGEHEHLRRGHELYKLLIQPLAERIEGIDHLIVSPNDSLWYLPFESLVREVPDEPRTKSQTLFEAYARARYVLEDFSFTYVPSATVWLELKKRRAADKGFVGVAPSLEGTRVARERGLELEPLPGARGEVRSLSKLFPDGHTLIGSRAVESAVKSAVAGRRYVHFAAHGYLNDERPALSGVMLWPEKRNEDGLLQGFEATRMEWDAELVSLAVCNSAMGQLSRGEGLLGFARTVLVGGARNALVTLWRVDDLASEQLVDGFYEHVRRGNPLPRSLQAARRKLLQARGEIALAGRKQPVAYAHPYYWAPYVLVGGDALERQPTR